MSAIEPSIPVGSAAPSPTIAIRLRARALRRKWRFAGHVATLSVGTAVAQAVSVAVAPIITRLYTPAQMGILGLFTSFLSVAAVATSLKYELGIVSATDDCEAAQLTWASIIFCAPVSVLCAAVLLAAVHFGWFGFGQLPLYAVWLFIPTLALTGVYTAIRYWSIRGQRFGLVSTTFITQHATRSALQTLLGFLSAGTGGLLFGEAAGKAISAGAMLRPEWRRLRILRALGSWSTLKTALRRHRQLPIYSLASSLIDTLAANLTIPLLIGLYGSDVGGLYSLVLKVLAVPLALIASSVADAFHSRLAICARETPDLLLPLFLRTAAGLFLLALFPSAILAIGGQTLFSVVFGRQWAVAGLLAAISTPWFLSQFVVSPLSRLVFVLRGQESKLIYDIVLLVSIFAAYEIARLQHLSIVQTVWAFTIVNTGAYILYFFVLLHIVRKSAHAPAIA